MRATGPMRWVIAGIAALVVGLGTSATAEASPYTNTDVDFVTAVTFYGYTDDTVKLINFGQVACENLDAGVSTQNVLYWVCFGLSNLRPEAQSDYFASLFVQSAAIAYCPWQCAANWDI